MGYTHGFKQKKAIDHAQWKMIVRSFSKILKALNEGIQSRPVAGAQYLSSFGLVAHDGKDIVLIEPEYNHGWTDFFHHKKDTKEKRQIVFNGIGHFARETFSLDVDDIGEMRSCKTNGMPYDCVVTAMLIATEAIAPGHYEIFSDGDVHDWTEGVKLLSYSLQKPTAIAFNEEGYLKVLPISRDDHLSFRQSLLFRPSKKPNQSLYLVQP